MKYISLVLLALSSMGICAQSLNTQVELIARASQGNSFNVPDVSYFQDVTPSLNDNNEIAARILSFEDRVISGVFLFKKGKITIPYISPSEDLSVSDVHLNNKGVVSFYLNGDGFAEGLYKFNTQNNQVTKLLDTASEKLFGLSGAYTDDAGNTYIRTVNNNSEREFLKFSHDGLEKKVLLSEKTDGISYLFNPIVSNSGHYIVKARLGEKGEWAEERPDVLYGNENFGQAISVRHYDHDFKKDSSLLGFRNSAGVSDLGDIAYVALNDEKKFSLYLNDVELLREGELDISSIDYFAPRVNMRGEVAFRYTDKAQRKVIGLISDGKLSIVAREGDLVESDLKTAQITSFHGAMDLNNKGRITFVATLYSKNKETYLGHGLFLTK